MENRLSLSGLKRVQGYIDGTVPIPPAWDLINCRIEWVQPGRCEFALHPTPTHLNYSGSIHGGILAAAADVALGCASLSLLPDNSPTLSTVELGAHYFRPAQPDTHVVLQAKVLKAGSRLTFANCLAIQNESEIATFRGVLAHA